jgi:hypothetical protein
VDAGDLLAFWFRSACKSNFLPGFRGFAAVHPICASVAEPVTVAAIGRLKRLTLGIFEPFDRSGCHILNFPVPIDRVASSSSNIASTAFGNQETPKVPVWQRLFVHFPSYEPLIDGRPRVCAILPGT